MWFNQQSVLSIEDFSEEDIRYVCEAANRFKEGLDRPNLDKSVMGSCFFEPSTRTRLSFEAAMQRLGGRVIGFDDVSVTSVTKGETLHDTIKMISAYVDVIVMRHPLEGAARRAAEISHKPVINAGDGANQHPTQTLVDLFSIQETQGTLNALHIAMVGDLKNGRTVHSLAQACTLFGARLYFVSSPECEMPQEICHELRRKGIKFSFHRDVEDVLKKIDILYLTRLQKERLHGDCLGQEMQKNLVVTAQMLQRHSLKNAFKVFHPLPRCEELCPSVDTTKYAYYFQQAANALFVRQALLALVLGAYKQVPQEALL